jgi:plastocyanin
MNKKMWWLVAIVVVVIAGVVMYSHSHENESTDADGDGYPEEVMPTSTDTTITPTSTPSASTTASTTGGVSQEKVFTITGSNFAFAPSALSVKKGDKVKIIFKNSGGVHDFKIDEFAVATPRINGGAEATVEFVANTAGTFEYYCSVGTHRQMGMHGSLTVTQ